MIRRGLLIGLLLLAVLAPSWALLTGSRIAFRDTSHFYLPLYDYVAQRCDQQWLPLWNPLDHTGIPLIGESTTAVLYPPRYLIYARPIDRFALSPAWALNLYLLFHLVLAAGGAAWLARRYRFARHACLAAGVTYALSGSVYSLLCNPVFLAGAAWLPWLLAVLLPPATCPNGTTNASDHSGKWSHLRWRIAFGAMVLAMMVLAGDPQTALHGMLVILAITLIRTLRNLADDRHPTERWKRFQQRLTQLTGALCVPVAAGLLALALSAVQVAAAIDWSRQSQRSAGLTAEERYGFSLGPWHASEILTPRPFGATLGINRSVSKLIPGEDRMWAPSLYAGMALAMALLCRLLKPRSWFVDPWFGLAAISLGFCLGKFGLMWLIQQITGMFDQHDGAVGGPYWLLCQLIPSYDAFRYPTKWLPLFAIGSSLVLARWIDHAPDHWERIVTAGLLATLTIGLIATGFIVPQRLAHADLPANELWGPVDGALAKRCMLFSGLLSVIWLVMLDQARHGRFKKRFTAQTPLGICLWIVVIAADAGISAASLLPTVRIQRDDRIAAQTAPPPIDAHRVLRTQNGLWPTAWQESVSPLRALEVTSSERISWFGRWHLVHGTAVLNNMSSIRPLRYHQFWQATHVRLPELDATERREFWQAVRRWLAIDAVSHTDGNRYRAAEGLAIVSVTRTMKLADEFQRRGKDHGYRIHQRWQAPLKVEQTVQLLSSGQRTLPALVAFDRELPSANALDLQSTPGSAAPDARHPRPRFQVLSSQQVAIETSQTVVLERCVYQDGNWHAELEPLAASKPTGSEDHDATSRDQQSEIQVPSRRASSGRESSGQARNGAAAGRSLEVAVCSHLNQAVQVPPGRWKVTFHYRPWWLGPTLTASAVGGLIWLGLIFLPRRARPEKPGDCPF